MGRTGGQVHQNRYEEGTRGLGGKNASVVSLGDDSGMKGPFPVFHVLCHFWSSSKSSCIGRWILNYWTTKETPTSCFVKFPQEICFRRNKAVISNFHICLYINEGCSTLAWKIPWTEAPGRLQSMGSLRVGHK